MAAPVFQCYFGALHGRILPPAVIVIGSVDGMTEGDLLFKLIMSNHEQVTCRCGREQKAR